MGEDPIKDGTNWYGYCAGNPVMFVDPSGLDMCINNYTNLSDAQVLELRMGLQSMTDCVVVITDAGEVNLINTDKSRNAPEHEAGNAMLKTLVGSNDTYTINYDTKAEVNGYSRGKKL